MKALCSDRALQIWQIHRKLQWHWMKLSLKCEVHSDIILSRRLELKAEDRTYCFEVDKQGRWNGVEIRVHVPDASKIKGD